mmetsp:Transcript_11088/g.27061  ORF Transcript_11088/g.27061 Transcript_11088/m.27061 type:complete len:288 (+) Transcript_11088:256-1119(+)
MGPTNLEASAGVSGGRSISREVNSPPTPVGVTARHAVTSGYDAKVAAQLALPRAALSSPSTGAALEIGVELAAEAAMPSSRQPAAQYNLPPPTSMKHTVRPTAVSLDAFMVEPPAGANSGNPSGPMAIPVALRSATSMTPRHITRPWSVGALSPRIALRTAELMPSAPMRKSATMGSSVTAVPSRRLNVQRTFSAPFASSSISSSSRLESRWMQEAGRKDASADCNAAHRMVTSPAPPFCILITIGNTAPIILPATFPSVALNPPTGTSSFPCLPARSSTVFGMAIL